MQQDDIGFGILVKNVRKGRKLSQEKLAKGIFSVSQMSQIEAGNRLPGFFERNRIMERLGVSAEGFEDYLRPSEYARYKRLDRLIEAVEDKNWSDAISLQTELIEAGVRKEKVEYQVFLDMTARIERSKGASLHRISALYAEAVEITMPGINRVNMGEYVVSSVEFYLLLKMLETKGPSAEDFGWIKEIVSRIIAEKMKIVTKAKILPYAAVIYADWFFKLCPEEIDEALSVADIIREAIESLRNSKRLYYIRELMEAQRRVCVLAVMAGAMDDSVLAENRKYQDAVSFLYDKRPNIEARMNDCFIYKGNVVYLATDVISQRRKMLKKGRREVADGLCSERTLLRIEQGLVDAQQFNINNLFYRLGLPKGFRRAEVVTTDFDTILLLQSAGRHWNNREYELAWKEFLSIQKGLDYSFIVNQQASIRWQNVQQLRVGAISSEVFVKRLWMALNLSGVTKENAFSTRNHLTRIEKELLYNIVLQGGECERCMNWCAEKQREDMRVVDFSEYEMYMTWYASQLGNRGKYKESMEVGKKVLDVLIEEYRGAKIAINLVNICWDKKRMGVQDHEEAIFEMKHIIALCDFMKQDALKNKVCKLYKVASSGDDWTI